MKYKTKYFQALLQHPVDSIHSPCSPSNTDFWFTSFLLSHILTHLGYCSELTLTVEPLASVWDTKGSDAPLSFDLFFPFSCLCWKTEFH